MPTEIQMKLRKIEKASTVFRVICDGVLALITVIGLAAVTCVTLGVGGINFDGGKAISTANSTLGHRLILGLVTAVAWAVLVKCFYHLRRLFRMYSRGDVFARESVNQLRQFGIACLLWGVLGFVWRMSLAIAVHPAQTFQAHTGSFAIGIFAIVIAWFMDMAVDLREENELTI
jgi:hypothetical protein